MEFAFRRVFAAELAQPGDARAIGGAVTVALCGHWEHNPPCRWPHHTDVSPDSDALRVTVDYTCAHDERPEVDALIDAALAAGTLTGPDGATTRWRLL